MVREEALTAELVHELLYRHELARSRHRLALARSLGLNDAEMATVTHLRHRRELTTTQIAALLPLSSAGATALVQRLMRAGIARRRPHPKDGRSALVRLTDAARQRIEDADAPLDDALADAVAALSEDDRAVVARFLTRVAELTERLAEAPSETGAVQYQPVPSLWG